MAMERLPGLTEVVISQMRRKHYYVYRDIIFNEHICMQR